MFGCISRHGEASGDGAMAGGKDEWQHLGEASAIA
jgi:serine/threonine protein kinase